MEAWCMKCKKKQVIKNEVPKVTKNNMYCIKGVCFECGTNLSIMLRKAKPEDETPEEKEVDSFEHKIFRREE